MKAAIFDMDGTLVDSLMLWDVLWSTFGDNYLNDKSFSPSVEDDKKVRTLTLKDAMLLIHNNYKLGESGEELLSLANSIMNDFYAMPAIVAFLIALAVAFMQNRGLSFAEKFAVISKGVGDENIITMCLIFLCAGAFMHQTGKSYVYEMDGMGRRMVGIWLHFLPSGRNVLTVLCRKKYNIYWHNI